MKKYLTLVFGLIWAGFAYTQNEQDALRYSYLNYNGTARFAGLGGAMGALGADMSAVGLNPAGMGRYSRSDFSFTGDLTFTNSKSLYNGSEAEGTKANFNISNIGAVFVKPISFEKPTLWRYFQFGITSSRTNDFSGRSRVEAKNDNSMLDSYVNYLNSNGVGLDNLSNFYEGLAYDAFLISHDSLSNEYFKWSATNDIDQRKTTTTRGAQYQTDFAFSGNYDGKLYLGASFGFPRIKYTQSSVFSETFTGDSVYDLEDYSFEEELRTQGNGFNMKFGVIYVPVNFLRFGFAYHTPTWYSMNDQFSTKFSSNFTDNGFDAEELSPEGTFDYRLRTPGRIMASMAVLFKKRGLISMEYEYVDYSNAKLNRDFASGDSYNFAAENEVSSELYQGASIIKVGGEFRVSNHWTIRGGYSYYGSPIKSDFSQVDASRTNISGGIGYKNRNFSLDMTYLNSSWEEESYLYDPELVTPITSKRSLNNFMVTAGFRF